MKKFKDIRILVVGDIMLDVYRIGNVSRISPEAPVPIINLIKSYHTLGGCGNVARNIKELNVHIDCLSSIAPDLYGKQIIDRLIKKRIGNMIYYKSVKTTVKERIISDIGNIQMMRIDYENVDHINILDDTIINRIKYINSTNKYNMIVISDYAKGVITKDLIDFLKILEVPIIIDPKPSQKNIYNEAFSTIQLSNNFMITPNKKEWEKLKNEPFINNFKYILVTKGKDGMDLICNNKNKLDKILTISSEPIFVYNVSGGGDVVLAVISVCLSYGIDIEKSIYIANDCARYSVTKPNTCVVEKEIFHKFLNKHIN